MIMNFIYQNELRDSQIPVCRINKIGIDRAESQGCFLSVGQEDIKSNL